MLFEKNKYILKIHFVSKSIEDHSNGVVCVFKHMFLACEEDLSNRNGGLFMLSQEKDAIIWKQINKLNLCTDFMGDLVLH